MQRKLIIPLLICFLALPACAPRLSVKEVDPGRPVSLQANEALVFGKIIFIENGKEAVPYGCSRAPITDIFHVESENKTRLWSCELWWTHMLERDGGFYWIIPRGTYIIPQIQFGYTISPQVAFQASFGADAYYLGTLRINVETKQIIAAHFVKKINSISVADEFESMKDNLLKRNPDFKGAIEKNLMIHDTSLPVDLSSYQQQKLLQILNSIGLGLLMQYHVR